MRIRRFTFGGTPLFYTDDGAIARGIMYPKRSMTQELAQWVFAFSVALLVYVLLFSLGRSMLARVAYAAHPALQTLAESALMQKVVAHKPALAALLVASQTRDISAYRNFDMSESPVLVIPRLGVLAPIVESAPDSKALNAGLTSGIVRWPESAPVGERGTTVLLGHSSAPLTYRGSYGSVFALLDKLAPGDTLTIQAAQGMLTYRVQDRIIVNRQSDDFIDGATPQNALILISCWPTGSAWKRIAVRAEQVYDEP